MIATEMPAAIRPYSMAVAPLSSRKRRMNADMTVFPWLRTPAHPERTGFLAPKSEDPMNQIPKLFAKPHGPKAQRRGALTEKASPAGSRLGSAANVGAEGGKRGGSAALIVKVISIQPFELE